MPPILGVTHGTTCNHTLRNTAHMVYPWTPNRRNKDFVTAPPSSKTWPRLSLGPALYPQATRGLPQVVAERGGVLQKDQSSREGLGLHCLYCNPPCDARFDPNPNSATPCRGLPNHIGQGGYGHRGCRGRYAGDGLMGRGKLDPWGFGIARPLNELQGVLA